VLAWEIVPIYLKYRRNYKSKNYKNDRAVIMAMDFPELHKNLGE
jgi:hypothetical protein